jgi:ABC-type glutathione transport system ATPase component
LGIGWRKDSKEIYFLGSEKDTDKLVAFVRYSGRKAFPKIGDTFYHHGMLLSVVELGEIFINKNHTFHRKLYVTQSGVLQPQQKKKLRITIEGERGSGKTTMMAFLNNILTSRKATVYLSPESLMDKSTILSIRNNEMFWKSFCEIDTNSLLFSNRDIFVIDKTIEETEA